MKKAVQYVVEDGESTRFREGEIELAPVEGVSPGGIFHAAALGDAAVGVVVFEAGFSCEFHHTPAPTWMLVMSGEMEVEVSDDETRVLRAGDLVHLSDAQGRGHRSRVLGDQEVIVATAGFTP